MVHTILDTAVEVDRQHALGTSGHATGTECIAESVVLDLVAQTAARAQRVGIVTQIGEKAVALSVHLSRIVGPFLVLAVAGLGQHGHRLDGEGEHRLGALLVKPLHEALLQPVESVPVGLCAVGEVEVSEDRIEVVFIVITDIPEHSLIVAGTGRLVERVDDLLEAVGDDLVDRALLQAEIHDIVGMGIVVLAIFLLDEVVHIHQELRCGAGSGEHAADHEHHVDETTAEALEVCRSRRVAADAGRTTDEPGVHRDGGTVIGEVGLVVLIYKVVCQLVDIFVSELFAIHFLDALDEQSAVQADEVFLW